MEDATYTLLQDFVDSLANLPSEVGHLLCEIAYLDYAKKSAKDDQPPVSQAGNGESGLNKKWYSVDESRRKAASKQSSIARHSHKPPNNLLTPNPKEPVLIERALAHYDDAIKLSKEKEKFASGAVNLVTRHLERLNQELAKLAATTGVEVPEFKGSPQSHHRLQVHYMHSLMGYQMLLELLWQASTQLVTTSENNSRRTHPPLTIPILHNFWALDHQRVVKPTNVVLVKPVKLFEYTCRLCNPKRRKKWLRWSMVQAMKQKEMKEKRVMLETIRRSIVLSKGLIRRNDWV
ncbi:hypothetical protein H4Q26_006389 [Puccinia striiformis f. sp. tritici PST-130]|nr:hypothetical protein H4Q26_006389 [Puccinia striiformis f. sp. tritici PST-130]